MKPENFCNECLHRDQLCDLCQYSDKGIELKNQIEKNLSKHFEGV